MQSIFVSFNSLNEHRQSTDAKNVLPGQGFLGSIGFFIFKSSLQISSGVAFHYLWPVNFEERVWPLWPLWPRPNRFAHNVLTATRFVHARSFAKCSPSHEFSACLQLSSSCSSAATGSNVFNTCGNVENAMQSELRTLMKCTPIAKGSEQSERLRKTRGE